MITGEYDSVTLRVSAQVRCSFCCGVKGRLQETLEVLVEFQWVPVWLPERLRGVRETGIGSRLQRFRCRFCVPVVLEVLVWNQLRILPGLMHLSISFDDHDFSKGNRMGYHACIFRPIVCTILLHFVPLNAENRMIEHGRYKPSFLSL